MKYHSQFYADGVADNACRLRLSTANPRRIGILDLLQWAFGSEKASLDFDHPGSQPAVSVEYRLMQNKLLGEQIDGGGWSEPHVDAVMVACVVAGLSDGFGGRDMALRIAELARAGQTPNTTCDMPLKILPRATHTNRHGMCAKTDDAARLGSNGWPNWTRRNRKGATVTEVSRYCPVIVHPSPHLIAQHRRQYLAWWGAVMDIRQTLMVYEYLGCHVLTERVPDRTPWKKPVDAKV